MLKSRTFLVGLIWRVSRTRILPRAPIWKSGRVLNNKYNNNECLMSNTSMTYQNQKLMFSKFGQILRVFINFTMILLLNKHSCYLKVVKRQVGDIQLPKSLRSAQQASVGQRVDHIVAEGERPEFWQRVSHQRHLPPSTS